jgi:short subunit dehydrogenase-like uncharacterized protein
MTPKAGRPLDLVLFGATGFTGRLVADHLAGSVAGTSGGAKQPLRWGLAGRDLARLEALAAELRRDHPTAPIPELLRADAAARADMDALAQRARVVCTTAGPFARHGSELVAACADAGTDYCDITGEVQWVRAMIDAHHDRAVATGARIVHFCGFDSIPSDLGTWALQQEMIARFGGPAHSVTNYVGRFKGGVSGGTFASMIEFAKAASADRELARKVARPYALNPDPAHRGPDGHDARGIGYDRSAGLLTMPFVMALTNARAVRRAHALAGFPWGEDFRYNEVASAPASPSGLLRALLMTGGLGAALVAASSPRLRPLLERRMPKPGEGPSEAERNAGSFRMKLVGRRGEHQLTYQVGDDRDPGYGSTCKMLGQSALCLAFDSIPEAPPAAKGGCLTPSIAMGASLLRRLRQNGLTFDVVDSR